MVNMDDLLADIARQISTFQSDSSANNKNGNKAAGVRARKASLQLTKLFKKYRKLSVA